MGVMGIWQWIIILAITLVLPFVAIMLNKEKPGITRSQYIVRVIGLIVLGVAMGLLSEMGEILALIGGVVILIASYFSYAFATLRLNNAGWSAWLTLVLVLPLINLLFIIALMIVPSKEQEAALMEA